MLLHGSDAHQVLFLTLSRSLQCQLKKFDCSILNVTKIKFIQSPSLFFFCLLHSIVWKVSPSKLFEVLFPRMLKRNPTDWKSGGLSL